MFSNFLEVYYVVKGAFKYKRLAIALACLLSLAGWVGVYLMSDIYMSKARVHMDSESVLRPLMKNMAVQYDINTMVRVMQQLMFTRPNLEQIITIAELDKGVDESAFLNLLESLKKDITIKPSVNKDVFDITYSAKSPVLAQRVVQAVLTVFSEQTQKKTLGDANSAQQFIVEQIQEYETRLRNSEKAKEEFQHANADLLSKGENQVSGLQNLKGELQSALTANGQALSRKNVLASQIQDISNSSEDWRDQAGAEEISPGNARIESLKDKRTEMLLKYTESHPSVKYIDKLINALEQQELADNPVVGKKPSAVLSPQKMSNPYVQNLKIALDTADAEVASTQALISSLKSQIDQMNSDWNKRLTVETEMKSLNRDYDTINKKYAELLERREQAQITGRIDDETSSLKFKIADPPDKPLKPSSPNRKILYSVIFVVALAAGFGLAFLINLLRPVILATSQLSKVTGFPVLGEISLLAEEDKNRIQKIDWFFWASTIILVLGYSFMLMTELVK